MRSWFFAVILPVVAASSAYAQTQSGCSKVLRGWVYDHDTRTPVSGATVSADPKYACGSDVTANLGRFELPMLGSVTDGASIRVFVAKPGYPTLSDWVTFPKDGYVQIELWSNRRELSAVHRKTKPPAVIAKANQAGRAKFALCLLVEGISTEVLRRYKSEYSSGLAALFDMGAFFSNAYIEHFPTEQSPGYSVFSTGAMPAVSGMVDNAWFDRSSLRMVTSTDDPAVQGVGKPGRVFPGNSPWRLLTRTVGDQLKETKGVGRVYSVSFPARAAVLLGGRTADGAFWFDPTDGGFVTSTFYPSNALPAWASDFNAGDPCMRLNGKPWTPISHSAIAEKPFFVFPTDHLLPCERLLSEPTPFSDEIVEGFAEQLVMHENLGVHDSETDILFVDLIASDYVGHAYGPFSAQMHDVCLRLDRLIGNLLKLVDRNVGRGKSIVVLASTHGMAPVPEEDAKVAKVGLTGGRVGLEDLEEFVSSELTKRFGVSKQWISRATSDGLYLSPRIEDMGVAKSDVIKAGAAALSQVPHILRVYTREQLIARDVPADSISQRVLNGFYAERSPDLIFIPQPYWQVAIGLGKRPVTPTTHGSPFEYDTHIPIIFVGPHIKHGEYTARVSLNDVAPTLAALLEIEAPAASSGKPLIDVIWEPH